MSHLNFEEKVRRYKLYLKFRYWTVFEATSFFNDLIEFDLYSRVHPEMTSMFGRDFYGLIPCLSSENGCLQKMKAVELKKLILASIDKNEITAFSLKMTGIKDKHTGDVTYFFYPGEVIALIVTKGHQLPLELQIATGLNQINNSSKSFSEPTIKQIKRQAIAQAFWYKYPDASISEICRRFKKLKKFSGFDFINDSETRNREVIKALRPPKNQPYSLIPGVFKTHKKTIAFDFQRLKIVVETIADLLIFADKKIAGKDLFNHPLIRSYITIGGDEVKLIIEYSLKNAFQYLATR